MALGTIALMAAAGIGAFAFARARGRGAKRKKLVAICAEIVDWTREEQNDFVRNVVRPQFDLMFSERAITMADAANWTTPEGHEFMAELFGRVTGADCNPAVDRAAYKVIWCAAMFWLTNDDDLQALVDACDEPEFDPWFQETGQ